MRTPGSGFGTAVITYRVSNRPVEVIAGDTTVYLTLQPITSISGTVTLKNPRAGRRGTLLAEYLREDAGISSHTAVRPDGTFEFPSVLAGKLRPGIRETDGYFASEISVEGADFRDGEIDILEGQSVVVRMVASDETGLLKGFAVRDDQPREGVLLVLAPAKETRDWWRYRGYQSDSDGSFEFRNVPAGDYLLFAVAPDWSTRIPR